jgi:site-specific DNA-methyltransferase (adenine-specific)
MSTEDICNLNIKSLCDKNCVLLLWATMPCLQSALKVLEAWGFKYKTVAFTWIKMGKNGLPIPGMGSYTKANAELCLLGMRGHIKAVDKTVRQVLLHERLGHSIKPPIIRDKIIQLFGDLPRIELFSRQKVEGWDSVGNEIDGVNIQDYLNQNINTNILKPV